MPDEKEECIGTCPFCKKKSHFYINNGSGLWLCFSCNTKGNWIDFYKKVIQPNNNLTIDVLEFIEEEFKLKVTHTIDEVEEFHKQLLEDEDRYSKLFLERTLTEEVINKYKLGLRHENYLFPIQDKEGRFINLKEHKGPQTSGSVTYLYPIDQLQYNLLYITEGEFDALALISHDFNAITSTGGASNWPTEFNVDFLDKDVVIIYDDDEPGFKGSYKVRRELASFVKTIRVINWQKTKKLFQFEGKDICDFLSQGGELSSLVLDDVDLESLLLDKNKSKFVDTKIEASILFSLSNFCPECFNFLEERFFTTSEHRKAYNQARETFEHHGIVDIVLYEELLGNNISKIEELELFQTRVKYLEKLANKRKVTATFNKLKVRLEQFDYDPSSLKEIIDTVNNALVVPQVYTIGSVIESRPETFKDRLNREISKTGFQELDNKQVQFNPGEIDVITSRTGVGKTLFKINLIYRQCMMNNSVFNFAPEMGRHRDQDRLDAIGTGIPISTISNGTLTEIDKNKLQEWYEKIRPWKYFVFDQRGVYLKDLEKELRRVNNEVGLNLVVFDLFTYLLDTQLIYNNPQQISNTMKRMSELAKELNAHFMLLAQISRKVEDKKIKVAEMSEIKGSGSFEEDADTVLILHRDAYYDPTVEEDYLHVKVSKNRNGPFPDSCRFLIDKNTLALREVVED